ncbi:MAG: arginase [Gammaproteobacteria bacterium]|nr:arginase [Gammaproteobacteria bacterium]
MTTKPLELIGAGQGWGAKYHEAQMGPQVLKDIGLLQNVQKIAPNTTWRSLLFPSQPYTAGKNLSYEQRLTQIENFSQKLANEVIASQHAHFPIIVGGDHTIAIGTWSAMTTALNAQGNFGLIWVDAHMDSHTPQTSHTKNIHGMPLAVLMGYGEKSLVDMVEVGPKLDPAHIVLIGVRSFEPEEAEFLKKLNVKIVFMDEVKSRGFASVFQEAVSKVSTNTKGFGISIDIDAFDPTIAPGTGAQEKNGILDVVAVKTSLKSISQNPKCKALEIVEFDPTRDIQHRTAYLVQDLISAML